MSLTKPRNLGEPVCGSCGEPIALVYPKPDFPREEDYGDYGHYIDDIFDYNHKWKDGWEHVHEKAKNACKYNASPMDGRSGKQEIVRAAKSNAGGLVDRIMWDTEIKPLRDSLLSKAQIKTAGYKPRKTAPNNASRRPKGKK